MKLAILIPTTPDRKHFLDNLLSELNSQINGSKDISIIINEDNYEKTIGQKRNELLESAVEQGADYVAFFDSDDMPTDSYIQSMIDVCNSGLDCGSLKGIITFDGINPEIFEHSIKYDKYETVEGAEIKYLRFPNHISCIKASIATQFKFPEKSWGEDTDWATQIHASGLIKTEHYIPEVIYHYNFINNK